MQQFFNLGCICQVFKYCLFSFSAVPGSQDVSLLLLVEPRRERCLQQRGQQEFHRLRQDIGGSGTEAARNPPGWLRFL